MEMKRYKFEVKEKAIGKSRPRWNGKFMYTPKKTSEFEEKIRNAFLIKYNIKEEPTVKPIKAKIEVFFEPPTSYSNKKKNGLYGKYYAKKPDLDNIAKAILDSLNGIAYKDDNQIAELQIEKKYDKDNLIKIELEEIE